MNNLTKQEIEIIKQEMKVAYVFSILLFCGVALFDLVYYLIQGFDSVLVFVTILILGLCILIPYLMNKNYNKDIRAGIKHIEIARVQDKECSDTYEAGSGNLYIPGLGDLFPKLWGSHPRHSLVYHLTVNNTRYMTEEDIYRKANIGDNIEMYFTLHSRILIGFGNCN